MLGDILGRLEGIPIVVGGAGIVYLSDYLPDRYRNLGKGAGSVVMAYGAYKMFSGKSSHYDTPVPGKNELRAYMTDPKEGEIWHCTKPHTINAVVQNPYDRNFVVYAYAMLYHEEEDSLYTADSPKEVRVGANSSADVSFWVKFDCTRMRGKWRTWILLLSQPDLDRMRDYFVGSSRPVSFTVAFL